MARKTIRMIEAEHRAETRRLNGIIAGEAAARDVQRELADDANARLIVEKADMVRAHASLVDSKNEKIAELIRGHAAVLAAKDVRISELFRSNNEYQAEARAARAEVARLQQALSDASRVIATLGQRTF